MKLRKAAYSNYRGIQGRKEVNFGDSSIFVGRNDAGKSTLLRGLDLFLNNSEALADIANLFTDSDTCSIELAFEGPFPEITIDEAIPTTLTDELLLDEKGQLRLKKEWDTSKSQIKPDTYIRRKTYGDEDFLLETERELIKRCRANGLETQKANGDAFNNSEKRAKLRQHLIANGNEGFFVWEKLPTTGATRAKQIHDQVKGILPRFEYFRADTALSETDASIQRYFKSLALHTMQDEGISDIEEKISHVLGDILKQISDKINGVLPDSDQVSPSVSFDWSKSVQTGFKSINNQVALPLTFRGDGFRRITMMSYFEHLAEEKLGSEDSAIFGFEEPETFLHPKAQEQLHEKLLGLVQSGYQVVVTTHSPTVVAASDSSTVSHVTNQDNVFEVAQGDVDLQSIADDLGITHSNQFIRLFESGKVLVLVEGPDDVSAFNFLAEAYRDANKIPLTFAEQQIFLVPVGGCDSVKHWLNLEILKDLGKPFYVIQDSDRKSAGSPSPNRDKLLRLGLTENTDFWVLRKRALENYLDQQALERLIPGLQIQFDDYTAMKTLCGQHASQVALGGKKVVEKHFRAQTFEEVERSFRTLVDEDEFIEIYNCVCSKVPSSG